MNLATGELYKVTAVGTGGATKVIAARVGGFKATRLAGKAKALGFKVEVERVDRAGKVWALKD